MRLSQHSALLLCVTLASTGCTRLKQVGKAPAFSATDNSNEYYAMASAAFPESARQGRQADYASLWSGNRESLLGDRRAMQRGDILTVVIEINDSASISNKTGRTRSGREEMGISGLLGLPQRINKGLPEGASMDDAINTNSDSNYTGNGTVARKEQLKLRVSVTVIDRMPNGILRIEGSQEIRVNNELRELLVSGYARPTDISRQNEITYDKISGARISYGGRGQITDVQQPRYGQQIADILLPF